MSIPEPLRNNPFRLRRRRSLQGLFFDDDYTAQKRPFSDASAHKTAPAYPVPAKFSKTYMSDSPDEYEPNPGFMDTMENSYEPYENPFFQTPKIVQDEFLPAAMGLGKIESNKHKLGIGHNDSLSAEDLFCQHLDSLRQDSEEPSSMPFDNNLTSRRIWESWLKNGGVKADHHLTADMFDIQLAIEKAKVIPFNDMQDAKLDYSALPDAYFDAQEALFDLPQPEQMAQRQQVLDQFMEEMNPTEDLEAQSLEQIIEAEEMIPEGEMANYDIQIEQGPLEQQVQEGFEQMDMEEPYPEPPAQGYGMIPQEMYDEQMQEMLDPFMIPGFYGPMSFGPMLGPGPGGP